MNKIYIITVYERMEKEEGKIPKLLYLTNIGWYDDFDEAEEAVKTNKCDIWETCYNYAIISEVSRGLYGSYGNEHFYKYNMEEERFEEMERPHELRHMTGFWC